MFFYRIECFKDYHYRFPSPEEVFNKLNGGKVFSSIVLSVSETIRKTIEKHEQELTWVQPSRNAMVVYEQNQIFGTYH